MADKSSKLLQQAQAGQRVWKAPAETKDALVRFQRDVVFPLRKLASGGAFRIRERSESYRGARFIIRVEIVELPGQEARGRKS